MAFFFVSRILIKLLSSLNMWFLAIFFFYTITSFLLSIVYSFPFSWWFCLGQVLPWLQYIIHSMNYSLLYMIVKSSVFVVVCSAGDWTWDHVHARQALYCWIMPSGQEQGFEDTANDISYHFSGAYFPVPVSSFVKWGRWL